MITQKQIIDVMEELELNINDLNNDGGDNPPYWIVSIIEKLPVDFAILERNTPDDSWLEASIYIHKKGISGYFIFNSDVLSSYYSIEELQEEINQLSERAKHCKEVLES